MDHLVENSGLLYFFRVFLCLQKQGSLVLLVDFLPAAVCLSRPKPFGCLQAALTGQTNGRYLAIKQNKA